MAPSQSPAVLLAIAFLAAPALRAQGPAPVRAGGVFFEPNLGQASPEVAFLARAGSSAVYLGMDGVVFHSRAEGPRRHGAPRGAMPAEPEGRVRLTLVGGRLADVAADERRGSITNYFLGPDRSRWLRGVPNYGRVIYRGVYAGVDLVFHARQGRLEYDFVVAPGADPAGIELQFEGQAVLRLDDSGDLILGTPAGELRHPRPRAFHESDNGAREDVAVEFVMRGGGHVGFRIGAFDRGRPLVIDPQVLWSTATPSEGWKLAASPGGRTYSVGRANGNVVLAGLDVDGNLAWTSYFGGARPDEGEDVALGPDGSVYVTGWTQSSDLPPPDGFSAGVPPGTPSGTAGGWSAKVLLLRFDQLSGNLLFFTWFGGTDGLGSPPSEQMSLDDGRGVAVDAQGYVYLTGSTSSDGFPVRNALVASPNPNGANTYYQGWAAKLEPTLQELVYSTYLRGSLNAESTVGIDVAADPWGNAHFVGATDAADYLVSDGAFDTSNTAYDTTGFVTKVGPTGQLLYSTYLGGANNTDEVAGVAIGGLGRACLTGRTGSTDFPVTTGPGPAGSTDTFATRLSVDGSALAYSRYLGGNSWDYGEAILVGPDDGLYVVGSTYSTNWPGQHGSVDQFVVSLTPAGVWDWNLTLGGTGGDQAWGGAIDAAGHVYTSGPLLGAGGVVTQIDVCGSGLTNSCGPALEILPNTTRWKPQRSDEPVEIHFVGPLDLVASSMVADLIFPEGDGSITVSGVVESEPAGGDCLPTPSEACYRVTWMGPWTYPGPQGPNTRLPAGRYVMKLRGEAGTAPPRAVTSMPYSRFALVEVENVRFEPELAGADLGENPNAGGGKAAYVDATVPGGDYRRLLKVVARVKPLMGADAEGIYAVFKWLDVDDPSAASGPIDVETDINQQCNLPGGGTVVGACDNTGQAPTPLLGSPVDVRGESDALMTLSTRQGDNYRVVASTDDVWAQAFKPLPGPNADGAVEHSSGEPQTALAPLISPLLTVWRTLHIESDYLTPSEPQSVWDRPGKIRDLTPAAPSPATQILAEGTPLRDVEHKIKGAWQGSDLLPDIGQPAVSLVVTGSGKSGDSVTVATGNDLRTFTAVGREFQVSDDRWVDLSQRLPLTLAASLAGMAYISLQEGSANSNVAHPWSKNLGQGDLALLPRDVASSFPYWAISTVAAFDYFAGADPTENAGDNDPDVEDDSVTLGNTTGEGSATNVTQPVVGVYLETLRDVCAERGYVAVDRIERVVAHEVLCHGLFLGHRPNDLCHTPYRDDAAGATLLSDRVAALRSLNRPCVCPNLPTDCKPPSYTCQQQP